MTTFNVSASDLKLCTNAVKSDATAKDNALKFNQALYAKGVTEEYFKAPKKDSPQYAEYDALKRAVLKAFTAAEQKLYDTPAKSLSDAKKLAKRELVQKLGSKVKDRKNSYLAFLKSHDPNTAAPRQPKALNTRLAELAEKMVTAVQKASGEDASSSLKCNVPEFIKLMRNVESQIK